MYSDKKAWENNLKTSINICFLGYPDNFLRTQKRVRISHGKRAIGARVIEAYFK